MIQLSQLYILFDTWTTPHANRITQANHLIPLGSVFCEKEWWKCVFNGATETVAYKLLSKMPGAEWVTSPKQWQSSSLLLHYFVLFNLHSSSWCWDCCAHFYIPYISIKINKEFFTFWFKGKKIISGKIILSYLSVPFNNQFTKTIINATVHSFLNSFKIIKQLGMLQNIFFPGQH